jgi:type IV pilus assembly protein PilM
MLRSLQHLLDDPPPLLLFEISDRAVVGVRRHPKTLEVEAHGMRPLAPGMVEPTLGRQNVHDPERLAEAVSSLVQELGPVKRPDAALFLPDASSRLTVLDFDKLPGDAAERAKLIRWRLKKTVPFDVDHAKLAYQPQPAPHGVVVFVAVTPPEIVRQYEAPLEQAGLWPGFVSVSLASVLNLVPASDMTLVVKMAGQSLHMAALDHGSVRMIRTVDLIIAEDTPVEQTLRDMVSDLYPTFIFIEDNLNAKVAKLVLCGFDELLQPAVRFFPGELGCQVEPLRAARGIVPGREAGIWGYMAA